MFSKISDVKDFIGKEVNLRGWIYRTRASNKMAFIVLRDSSGIIQCVLKSDNPKFEEGSKLLIESAIEVSGTIKEDERAPGGYEINVTKFNTVHAADIFPITKDQSTEHLLDVRHLWLRSRKLTEIFKIRSAVFGAIHEFFRLNGFYEIQSPSLTASACEGGSTLFDFKYFGQKAYLTQSWQLYAEAMIFSLEKIYCIAPSFRAEKSRTRRHLAEYWHAETEAAWMTHEENMKLQEDLLTHVLKTVIQKCQEELKFLGRDPKELEKFVGPYQKVKYADALEIMKKDGFEMKWGDDFGADEERQLTSHFNKPFFLVEFPKEAKAFYMKMNPNDPKTVLNNDLLAPEGYGEIIGGSERETDNNAMIERIKQGGGNPKDYEWYLDLRKFGSVPHSGFGLGVERLIMWICKLDHIRDTIAFPRVMNRIYP